MANISLDIARRHLRRDPDDTDPLVEIYLEAAEESAMQYLNRRFYADADTMAAAVLAGTAGESPILMTKVHMAAVLLTLGSLDLQREDVVVGTSAVQLPQGARQLLFPDRVGLGC